MSVRLLTPFFNIYGVVTLVGGALWSALFYYRRRTEPNRMTGYLLIAGGAILIAIGGSLNRFGFEGLNVTDLASAILLFWGFVLVSQRQASGSAHSSADSTVTSSV
jgi:membrane-bound ClpP family serine protease